MPALVGAVNIISIGASSVFNIGDVYTISPQSAVRTYAGAGSFISGDNLKIYNYQSQTNTFDIEAIDQPLTGNV